MKPFFILLLTLIALKLLSFTFKSSLPTQEIQSFILSEKLRQETEVSIASGRIKDLLWINKDQITSSVFPVFDIEASLRKFYFPDMHHYLVYLIQNNSDARLDSIENMNVFPQLLENEIKELHAINEISNFLKSKNFGNSPYASGGLIPIIHSLKENDGDLNISMQLFEYPDVSQFSDMRIMVEPTNEIFYNNPFKYNRDKKNVKVIISNIVTNEDEVIAFE